MRNAASDRLGDQWATIALRVGLGSVFVVFGLWKAMNPVDWILFLPDFVTALVAGSQSLDGFGVLKLMGFVEAVLGVQLLTGMFTRTTGALCAFLLAGIVFHIGLTQIGLRDLGLLGASLALWAGGGGAWSVDRWLERQTATASDVGD